MLSMKTRMTTTLPQVFSTHYKKRKNLRVLGHSQKVKLFNYDFAFTRN